jgi:hypothetical protein
MRDLRKIERARSLICGEHIKHHVPGPPNFSARR